MNFNDRGQISSDMCGVTDVGVFAARRCRASECEQAPDIRWGPKTNRRLAVTLELPRGRMETKKSVSNAALKQPGFEPLGSGT